MRCLVQRVSAAQVEVAGRIVGQIGPGLCVLVGVHVDDGATNAVAAAKKLATLRIFEDEDGKMNRSVLDGATPQALVVSQFTLYADTRKGRRPSWSAAAPGAVSEPLVEAFVTALAERGARVETGRFGAMMEVSLVNDGPMTLVIEL